MKEIEFDKHTQFSGYKNRFEDMFFDDKFYLIVNEDKKIIPVEFFNKEKIKSYEESQMINRDFTNFCKEQLKEARDDENNDIFITIYQDKCECFSSYDEIDLRKVNLARYIINSNPENETLYFPNPEMVCDSCYLEKAIGKIKLLEFDNHEERNKFVYDYEWKQLVDYTENKQKSVQDYTQN